MILSRSSLGFETPILRESMKEGSEVFEFLKDDFKGGSFSYTLGFSSEYDRWWLIFSLYANLLILATLELRVSSWGMASYSYYLSKITYYVRGCIGW